MTGQYILSPLAKCDIQKIWDYTANRWGIDQAETYICQLWKHIEAVARQPAIARPCPEVRKGYYKYPSGSHVLFFRISGNDIDIVRILHQSMDFIHLFDA